MKYFLAYYFEILSILKCSSTFAFGRSAELTNTLPPLLPRKACRSCLSCKVNGAKRGYFPTITNIGLYYQIVTFDILITVRVNVNAYLQIFICRYSFVQCITQFLECKVLYILQITSSFCWNGYTVNSDTITLPPLSSVIVPGHASLKGGIRCTAFPDSSPHSSFIFQECFCRTWVSSHYMLILSVRWLRGANSLPGDTAWRVMS